MERMKDDMAGGAAVACAMRAIALLQAPIRVIGVVPATENMPGGRAIKPGDVLTSASGKTVEVINTDAEGRLILGDGLWYARQLGATHLVDVATLTGAVRRRARQDHERAVRDAADWVEQVRRVADRAGDRVWPMPLFEEYRDQLKSEIADFTNTGGRPAGSITAALFISEFTGGLPWVHLDIAGTAWAGRGEAVPAQRTERRRRADARRARVYERWTQREAASSFLRSVFLLHFRLLHFALSSSPAAGLARSSSRSSSRTTIRSAWRTCVIGALGLSGALVPGRDSARRPAGRRALFPLASRDPLSNATEGHARSRNSHCCFATRRQAPGRATSDTCGWRRTARRRSAAGSVRSSAASASCGVGQERDFRQHARHRCANQDEERRLFDAEILDRLVRRRAAARPSPAAPASAKSRDSSSLLFSAIALTKSGSAPIDWPERGVLPGRHRRGAQVVGEVQEVGLDPPRLGVGAGIGVNREKQVRAFAVGDRRPFLERHELVGPARQNDLDSALLLEQLLEPSATSRTSSASVVPLPFAPGSWPPCPGSMTIRETPSPSCRAIETPG